jgi:hypothetical protein
MCHHIYFIALIAVEPHGNEYHMYITNRSFYALNCIWLHSYETMVYIDRFLHYILLVDFYEAPGWKKAGRSEVYIVSAYKDAILSY